MSAYVLHTDSNKTLAQLENILLKSKFKYIHFSVEGISDSGKNIIELSFLDNELKKKLILFTNAGYFVYVHRGTISSFVHFSEIKNLWIPVKDNTFSINSDGIVYSFKKASCTVDEKLLIIFSQMPLAPYSASLYRYFATNFSTIEKYVGGNVSILRIADIGGITGSFYLDTIFMPDNTKHISKFLSDIMSENSIKKENVVLYGGSKGGTAACYYGLTNYYKFVAVDPILNDDFYISKKNDLHLIEGIFPEQKDKLFRRVIEDYSRCNEQVNINIVTSQNSEQYTYVMDIMDPLIHCATIANSLNSNIKNHPTVGPNTIHMTVSMINMALSDIKLSKGIFDFI